jgi:glycosyltransferase involved in cell wall biosynthesis
VLNAWRSAGIVEEFRRRQPTTPVVALLTGTDIFPSLGTHPEALACVRQATQVVSWHREIDLPAEFRHKWRVIPKSVPDAPVWLADPGERRHAVVLAHLRQVKQPFLAAAAASALPSDSRIQVSLIGGEREDGFAAQAESWMQQCDRFHWRGAVSRDEVWQELQNAWVSINSSQLEGGANAVMESLAVGVPVLASHMAGNRGLLGPDYPGYFPVGDAVALKNLLLRCERDPVWFEGLRQHVLRLRAELSPLQEQAGWAGLVQELVS